MATRIQRVVKGQAPSLLDSSLANLIIDTCNAFRNLEVLGGSFSFFKDRATLSLAPSSLSVELAFPLNVYAANSLAVAVRPGKVNGIVPTAAGVAITEDHQIALASTALVYLVGTISTQDQTYGDLISVEVVASVDEIESTFESPALLIAEVEITGDAITNIRNAVFSDLQLVRFYADYVWTANNNGGAA